MVVGKPKDNLDSEIICNLKDTHTHRILKAQVLSTALSHCLILSVSH